MADLFLSYARPDRPVAERIAAALAAAGYSVWWDRHLTGGAEFAVDIERELEASEVVLVAWSEAAGGSPWVKDEAAVGREEGKLVALSLDATPPPLGFRQYHAIDFSGWNGASEEPEFQALLSAIQKRRKGEEMPAPVARPRGGRTSGGAGRRGGTWWWPAFALAVAAILAVWWFAGPMAPGPSTAGGVPRVLVTSLKNRGAGEVDEIAAALTESIASGLSRFPHLHVVADNAGVARDRDDVAYVVEGALVRAGPTARLTVQLFKTDGGEQVWGKSYDRSYDEDSVLQLQDDLTANVVASLADPYGALMRDLSAPVAQMTPEAMSPYEAVLRHLVYRQRLGPLDHAASRDALEHAAGIAPNDANVQAALAAVYTDEFKHSYNVLPGSLDRALTAARKATTLDPDNAFAHFALAETQYFRQDLGAFRAEAERAIALNPYDSDAMAMIGILMSYGGHWERGVELSRRAMTLNPNHPGWYRFGIAFDQLRRGDYESALETAQRINLPMYFADPYLRAVLHGYLGQEREARAAAQEFVALWPLEDFDAFQKQHLARWFYATPEVTRLTLEGLRLAGLHVE